MGIIEKHAPGEWRKTARTLGDSRDLFRPKTSDIPAEPGVYKWRDGEGRVIYVGKAKNLRNRLTNYFQPLDQLHPRTQTMVLTARSLEWTVVGTELEALTLEYTWIKEFDPRFNVVFRDDKTYPYLAISVGEEVPRVWVTRNRKRKDTRYFGPYAKVWELRHSLDKLLKTFPVRTCTQTVFHRAQMTGRPCLLASIGKCSAPCVGAIGIQDHRREAEHLVGVLTGRFGKSYINQLTKDMKQASADLDFEKAARLRDEIQMLQTVSEQNAVVFDSDVDADVFGLQSDELEASVHAFFVRAGSIRGERNWTVERVEDVSDNELISDLIVQVYSDVMGEDAASSQMAVNGHESDAQLVPPDSVLTTVVSAASDHDESTVDGNEVPANVSSSSEAALADVPSVTIVEKRDAVGSTQTITATDSLARAHATKTRRERQLQTGRSDLLAPIAPVPREVIVPITPNRRDELEQWLGTLRGATVTIRVPSRGEKRILMERATDNAKQALQRSKMSRISDMGARTQAMNDVAKALGLSQAPLRIECYDISNTIGGAFQVASMVVFEDAIAKKSEYRRFAIRGNDGKGALDDLSALYETLTRRFRHGNIAGDSGESLEAERRIHEQENGSEDDVLPSQTAPSETVSSDTSSSSSQQTSVGSSLLEPPSPIPSSASSPESSSEPLPKSESGSLPGFSSRETSRTRGNQDNRESQENNDSHADNKIHDDYEKHDNQENDESFNSRENQGYHGSQASVIQAPVVQQNAQLHHFAYKPNLVVVDGGKPQVMAAAQALHDCDVDDVAVCGLAKRLEEVWVPDDDYPIILKRQSEGMYLLQRVRDESHRFAITYHRQTRRKGALRSALDDIPGIGEAYQKRLLNAFGSVREMRTASLDQLQQVRGIGKAKAETIYQALHRDDETAK